MPLAIPRCMTKPKYSIRVHYWNPNGTNDIEIVNSHGEVIDSLCEALFGVNIGTCDYRVLPARDCFKYICVSPITDGRTTLDFFHKYF